MSATMNGDDEQRHHRFGKRQVEAMKRHLDEALRLSDEQPDRYMRWEGYLDGLNTDERDMLREVAEHIYQARFLLAAMHLWASPREE